MSKTLSQKDMLLKNILKKEKSTKIQGKPTKNVTQRVDSKGNIDVKAKNRKSQ